MPLSFLKHGHLLSEGQLDEQFTLQELKWQSSVQESGQTLRKRSSQSTEHLWPSFLCKLYPGKLFCKGQKLEPIARHRGVTSWEGDRCAGAVCVYARTCVFAHTPAAEWRGLTEKERKYRREGQRVALKRFESRSLLTRFLSQALWTLAWPHLDSWQSERKVSKQPPSAKHTAMLIQSEKQTNTKTKKKAKMGRRDLAFVFGKTLFCSYG